MIIFSTHGAILLVNMHTTQTLMKIRRKCSCGPFSLDLGNNLAFVCIRHLGTTIIPNRSTIARVRMIKVISVAFLSLRYFSCYSFS